MPLLTRDKIHTKISLASYNYRYFLPYAPEWGTKEFCNRRLQELLDFCKDARIDAVQFFVNTRWGTYYMPAVSAESQIHWAEWMKEEVAPAIRKAGIQYQLNFQMLLGAGGNTTDLRSDYDWEFLVDQYGNETLGCACPIGPVFREKMGEMIRLWAATEPEMMWIDDDFRMHNHGTGNPGLDFYCYCDTHLEEFASNVGTRYSREELVAQILRPGVPSRVRLDWLDFLNDTMIDSAAWIYDQVHDVSPHTRLALMTSAPDVHSVEGRDWRRLLGALSGPYTPVIRPCSGVYSGTKVAVKDQTVTYRFMAQTIAVVEQTLGAGAVEFAPELENTRFTTWSKSVSNTQYVLELGQLLGCPEITLSINDLEGSPIADEPTTLPMLQSSRPRLDSLAGLALSQWEADGVAFLSDPQSARKMQLPQGSLMQDLGLLRSWEDVLLQMGIPAKYVSAEQMSGSQEVVVLEEYTAWCPTDDEIIGILSGAVLLDGGAAKVLQKRGFEEYLGLEVGDHMSCQICSEAYLEDVLPGMTKSRVPHRGQNWFELRPHGATIVSQFIDCTDAVHTGSTIFENSLGGRVAVYGSVGDFEPLGMFGSHGRLRWLHGILRWISRERMCPIPQVPHHTLALARNRGGERLFAIANLGTDMLSRMDILLSLEAPIAEVLVLSDEGLWVKREVSCKATETPGRYRVSMTCCLNTFNWLVLRYG